MRPFLLLALLSPGIAAQPVALEPCDIEDVSGEVRCGRIDVPENPARPSSRKIQLNVVVLQPGADRPAADPLVVMQGGPGQAATRLADFYARVMSKVRERRAIVLVDVRGTGGSNPLACDLYGGTETMPASAVDLLPTTALRACRSTLATRADLTQYTTMNIVRDIEAVRARLGYERLNLYGTSYGTRVAQEYLRRQPSRVRTMILKGIMPPSLAVPITHARGGQRVLEMTIDRCEQDLACRTAFPRLRAELASLAPRLRSMSGETLRNMLYSPASAARALPVIHRAAAGDFKPLEEAIVATRRGFQDGVAIGMFLSVTCTEDVPFLDAAQVRAMSDGTFLGDYRVRQQQQACEGWPHGDAMPDARQPVRSDVPALLISGLLDPVTPPQFGEEIARSLPNSRHVVVPDHGHPMGTLAECATRFMAEFVENASARDIDLSCVDRIEPAPLITEPAPAPP